MSPARGPTWKWWVCGALLLATMLNYMDRQTLSLTATQLKTEISLDDGRYGALEEWFSYAFAFGGVFFGFVADRIGPRRLYPIVLVGWSLAGIATPLANWPPLVEFLGDPSVPGQGEFRWLFLCRTLLGFCEAGHWPCALLTARNILSESQRPMGNSILQSGASFGAVATPLVIEAMHRGGAPWQAPFVIIGIVGLAWVPLWLWLVRSEDNHYRPPEKKETSEAAARLPPPLMLFAALFVIVITISLAWQFQRAWLPKYLKEHHAYSESTANLFTSLFYLVAGFGSLFFGSLVSTLTRIGLRLRWARVLTFAGCSAFVALGAAVPFMEPGVLLLISLILMGAGSLGAHPQYYALAQELPPKHLGLLSGILSASSWVAVGRMQGMMGDYIKRTGSYDLPLILTGLAPIAGLVALTVWVALRPRAAGQEERDYA
jgi:MFS transporter, ACS family, hexuronate transporter